MECRLELKKASSDRPPFGATEKKIVTKESQRSAPHDKFRDDKRGLSYSDFHREITRKVEDIYPKRLENPLKPRIGRTASGERDLVKYKSYVPSYIKKYEKYEEKDVKVGGLKSQDLINRQRQPGVMDKHTRSSLSNTSTSSLWTDESSTDSSKGMCASPSRKRMNHPPLQFYLMSSKPGDCSQVSGPPRDNVDTSQSHSTRRDEQVHQSPCATAFQLHEKKDADFKIVPKSRTFMSPSRRDIPSCTRVISTTQTDELKKKGEKLDERIRSPPVYDLFGKEKPAAIFVPRIVSQKQFIGLSKFYDSKVLLAERVAETNRKGFSEILGYGQGAVMDQNAPLSCPFRREADGSKPFLKRISFMSAEKNKMSSERPRSAPRERKAESSPSRSRTLDRRPTETLPKQSDEKSAKASSERGRSISPFRRLSFSIGKSNKTSNSEESKTPPHLSKAAISSRPGSDNPFSSYSDGSSFDKTTGANRGRSSPLRRLLEPLIKPKASNSFRSPEPSQTGETSSHQKHSFPDDPPSSSTLLSKNGRSSTIQALFRVTSKNDQPLFTFAVDQEQSITAATIRKHIGPEKDDLGHKYTFFTVEEVQKKNGKWMNHGRKVQNQEYTSNIVAQMRVSRSQPLSPTGEVSVGNIIAREFVLFASESQRTNELAAIVIKIPKIADGSSTKDPQNETTENTLGDCLTDVSATVILPSGIHSLPHRGGPSSLIQRWKSGGACDCGGWDMGCNLRILTNHHKHRNPSHLLEPPSTSDAFKLLSQDNQPILSFTPYREGVYAVEYNSSLSLLQSFSICIAVNEGRNLLKTTEPNTSHVEKACREVPLFRNERMKSFSGPLEGEIPARYIAQPPVSPVGRV